VKLLNKFFTACHKVPPESQVTHLDLTGERPTKREEMQRDCRHGCLEFCWYRWRALAGRARTVGKGRLRGQASCAALPLCASGNYLGDEAARCLSEALRKGAFAKLNHLSLARECAPLCMRTDTQLPDPLRRLMLT
jgi:hypothetical protein